MRLAVLGALLFAGCFVEAAPPPSPPVPRPPDADSPAAGRAFDAYERAAWQAAQQDAEAKRLAAVKASEAAAAVKAREDALLAEADKKRKNAACIADPKCMHARFLPHLCKAVADRRETLDGIALEKAYARKTGVINLRLLEGYKNQLIANDETLAEGKAEYLKAVGRRWDGRCPKPKGDTDG